MMEGQNSGLSTGLWLMSFAGFTVNKYSIRHILLVCLATALTVLVFLLNFIRYFVDDVRLKDITLDDFIKQVETGTFCIQIFIKLFLIWYGKKNFIFLLNMRQQFLQIDSNNTEKSKKLLSYLKKFRLVNWSYLWFAAFNVIMGYLKPFYANELPVPCWLPNNSILNFNSMFLMQIVWHVMIIPYIVGFDVVFYGLCAELFLQIKLLCYQLKEHKSLDEVTIGSCVEQHIFLIKFINKMENIFSSFFIMQLLNAVVFICLEFYFSVTSESNIGSILYRAFITTVIAGQLALYCFLASEISDKAEEIGHAILSGEWYRCSSNIKKSLLLILLRSQKPLNFTAGGVVPLNRATLTQVFKSSMSFFTALKSLKENN